jgi:hypothetical protein
MAEAKKLAPSALERLFLEERMRDTYQLPKRKTLDADWQSEVLKHPPGWKEFARIFPLADITAAISRWSGASWGRASNRLETTVAAMVKQAGEKDFADLADFLDGSGRMGKVLSQETGYLLRNAQGLILREVEGLLSGGATQRPWMQLSYLLALEATDRFSEVTPNKFFERLDLTVTWAEKSGDSACVAKANALRERLISRFSAPDPSYSGSGDSESSLLDLLADALEGLKGAAEKNSGGFGGSRKSRNKSSSKKASDNDQPDLFL